MIDWASMTLAERDVAQRALAAVHVGVIAAVREGRVAHLHDVLTLLAEEQSRMLDDLRGRVAQFEHGALAVAS